MIDLFVKSTFMWCGLVSSLQARDESQHADWWHDSRSTLCSTV